MLCLWLKLILTPERILNLDFTQYAILLRFFLISKGYMWRFIKACIKICNLKTHEQISLDKMEQFVPRLTTWKLVAVSQRLIWTIKFFIVYLEIISSWSWFSPGWPCCLIWESCCLQILRAMVCDSTPLMFRITAFAWEILLTGWDSPTVLNPCEYKWI